VFIFLTICCFSFSEAQQEDDVSITELKKKKRSGLIGAQLAYDSDVEVLPQVECYNESGEEFDDEEVVEEHVDVEDDDLHEEDVDAVDSDDAFVPKPDDDDDDVMDINEAVAKSTSSKKSTSSDWYSEYPPLPEEFPSIREPTCNRDILESFELYNDLEITPKEVPWQVRLKGNRGWFKYANNHLLDKLKAHDTYRIVTMPSDKNERILVPKCKNLKTLSVPEFYKDVNLANQRNWVVPLRKFNHSRRIYSAFRMICSSFSYDWCFLSSFFVFKHINLLLQRKLGFWLALCAGIIKLLWIRRKEKKAMMPNRWNPSRVLTRMTTLWLENTAPPRRKKMRQSSWPMWLRDGSVVCFCMDEERFIPPTRLIPQSKIGPVRLIQP